MAKKRKKLYRAEVIKAFKKYKDGALKTYIVGDTYITSDYQSIKYLKSIKIIKE